MKKFIPLLVVIFLLLWVIPAFALIRTRNVDIDQGGFQYKVAYQFATEDVGRATEIEIPTPFGVGKTPANDYYYTMPFKGSIVGVSIASNANLTAGSVTADVTIDGEVTGVRTALDGGATTKWVKSGGVADHRRYNYNTIKFDDDSPDDWGGGAYDANHPYGKATSLVAGNRIGVKITTSAMESSSNSDGIDLVVTVIILQ